MKIAVIGGCGKMGQWLCRHLAGEGFELIIADRYMDRLRKACKAFGAEVTQSNTHAVKDADVVIISVPIGSFEGVVKEIGLSVQPGQIVMDITSIKVKPVALMHGNIKQGIVLGAHPLFGPDVDSPEGQNFILTPTTPVENEFAAKAEKYLMQRGAKVKIMSPQAHDKLMAVVQGLSHFVAIISADALAGLGDIGELKESATTTFDIFLNYIRSVTGDDPALYAAIQMEHPEMPQIYRALETGLQKWAALVERKDTAAFVTEMDKLKGYMGQGKGSSRQ